MTFKMGILISCTSVLWFLAALLGSYQLLELWDRMIKSRLREPVDRFLQLRMSEYWMTEGLRAWSILLIAAVLILFVYCRRWFIPFFTTFAFSNVIFGARKSR